MKTDTNLTTGGANMARRSFLRYAGASAATVAILGAASCRSEQIPHPVDATDIGSGDIGILNYAYALEQLEAAFYMQVVATPYSGISTSETAYLTDIRDHEVLHRDFFKTALGSAAIKGLTPDFSTINFSDRASVLGAAKLFEDTGVKAYDGAGYLIQSPDYLTIAGKIVSVEARHAALIANLITPGSFVNPDQVDENGINRSASIAEILSAVNGFLKTKVIASSFGYDKV
ncbi:ferritin-like domain-containing protein [Mucilaginibacter pedocola]|uniref:Tat (Twin-arginine translocation) pathway signal sequence containing protein n=1 Tax=Mucilaginibacter pedocola TaxID=1792845 RepID=A0A1S9PC23_9SPHI|nr:ferritin-like domain-containing protein [Mucilaginibacter pedocola]OOQ58505.1 Tat (twin-arginine translocation) pathway signal sequence containing protein [Mucilaginibacter pedocola]